MKLLIKIVTALFIATLMWEVILEVCMIRTTGFISDPVLGRIYKSGYRMQALEGYSSTHINKYGMRGGEIEDKRANEYRILTLGDSFTEGFQVSDEDTYTYQLQDGLRQISNKYITAINGGRSRATVANHLYLANFYNNKLKPDMVIIQVNNRNFQSDLIDHSTNFYIIKENGLYKVAFNNDFASLNPIIKKYPQLLDLLELSVLRIAGENVQKMLNIGGNSNNAEVPTTDVNSKVANSEIIDWTLRSLKAAYPRLILIYIPSLDYDNINKPCEPVEKYVITRANAYNIKIINMRQEYINDYIRTKQPAYGFDNTTPGLGHINKIGHRLIAKKLIEYMKQEELVP